MIFTKDVVIALLSVSCTFAAPAPSSPLPVSGSTGKWVVKLQDDIKQTDIRGHLDHVRDMHRRSLSRRQTAGVERQYDIGGFHAYVGDFDDSMISELTARDEVALIEPDYEGTITSLTSAPNSPWGLAALSTRTALPTADIDNQTYTYDTTAGFGTTAYVLDTGINIAHPGFEGRAVRGTNVWPAYDYEECAGHGTHVAGTVGSARFGVAKRAAVVDVKTVRSCGYGTVAKTVEALEWVARNATGREGRSVVNISLAFPASAVLDAAVDALVAQGVFVVVGAGNDGKDASTRSPAGAAGAFTVGAIGIDRVRPSWSNFGPAVDVFAAGVRVRSTSIFQDGTELLDGTSMASPHVAGLACYLKGLEGAALDATEVLAERIRALATKDVVGDAGVGSPNLLAYNGNGL